VKTAYKRKNGLKWTYTANEKKNVSNSQQFQPNSTKFKEPAILGSFLTTQQ